MSIEASLHTRPAGYAVMGECLRMQTDVLPRSAVRRFFGMSPLHPDAVSWYRGAIGEIEVGRELARLGAEWSVLHAVPVGTGDSDIDHVLIGPAGVFTVNTKHHAGAKIWVGARRLLVAGQKTDHLRNAKHEAVRASKLLTSAAGFPVTVRSLLVIVGAQQITVKQQPEDVAVFSSRGLVRWLNRRKPQLSEVDLAAIQAVSGIPATWHKSPQTAVHDIDLFHALRAEVEQARRRRLGWVGLVLVGMVAAAIGLAGPVLSVVIGAGTSLFL